MLKALTDEKAAEALEFAQNDIFSLWISAGIRVYGTDPNFIRTWYGEDESGGINCLMSLSGQTLRGSFLPDADFESAKALALMVGAEEFIFDAQYGHFFDISARTTGKIMSAHAHSCAYTRAQRVEPEKLAELFAILFTDSEACFGKWYTELSHRVRHSIGTVFAVYDGEKPVSTASVLAENRSFGLITDVATLPEYRNRGFAGDCVRSAVDCLYKNNKSAVLLSANSKTTAFYEKIGFAACAEWVKI